MHHALNIHPQATIALAVFAGRGIHSAPLQATAVVDSAVSSSAGEAKELFFVERVVGGGNFRVKSLLLPDGSTQVHMDASEVPDNGNLVLHWGVSKSSKKPHDWDAAPEPVRPDGTSLFGDGKATRTPFNGGSLVIHVPEEFVSMDDGPATLVGIAVRSNPGSEEQWLHADDGAGAPVHGHVHVFLKPNRTHYLCLQQADTDDLACSGLCDACGLGLISSDGSTAATHRVAYLCLSLIHI